MTPRTLYEDAQAFIRKNDTNYNTLLDVVKSACKRVEGLERQSVKTTYSRGEKQKNRSELKETWKLPKKLLKIRQDQEKEGANKPRKSWKDLPDVIGVTVVVYYPDQTKPILKRVLDELRPQGITLDEPIREKTEFGYHAVHAVVISKHGLHVGLRCEVQCKTMLHDSWATKMHDLTYKPMGYLEPRLELLMQAFGDTLERVERQSQAIRDMIMEKWNAEAERRRLTHGLLFSSLGSAMKQPDISSEAKKIRKMIEKHKTAIAQAVDAEEGIVKTIRQKIDSLCQKNLEEGWVLAALIASFRPKPDLVAFLDHYAEAWLEEAAERLRSKDHKMTEHQRKKMTDNILTIPLAYISAGNIDLAIDCYVKLLGAPRHYNLNKGEVRHCRFNYANALVERHYYEPDENRDGPLKELQARVSGLLKQSGPLNAASKGRTDQATELAAASVEDTNGFTQISLGSKPKDVSTGIDLCNRARLIARKHQFALGEQYCDLHLRLGWRKLLELEARKLQVP
jgi:ppGpp synthetase/RelA/SpoT-type nucleotidyltranferase